MIFRITLNQNTKLKKLLVKFKINNFILFYFLLRGTLEKSALHAVILYYVFANYYNILYYISNLVNTYLSLDLIPRPNFTYAWISTNLYIELTHHYYSETWVLGKYCHWYVCHVLLFVCPSVCVDFNYITILLRSPSISRNFRSSRK